jgi:hypothetical protein
MAEKADFRPTEAGILAGPGMATQQPEISRRISLRAAINGCCRACIHDPHAPGTWRQQVEACTSSECALHAARPRSSRPAPQASESPGC